MSLVLKVINGSRGMTADPTGARVNPPREKQPPSLLFEVILQRPQTRPKTVMANVRKNMGLRLIRMVAAPVE